MDQIDAVEHLGAPRARNGLGDAEELLVYLLVNPFQLDCKFVAELSNTISLCSDQLKQLYGRPLASHNLEMDWRAPEGGKAQAPMDLEGIPSMLKDNTR